MLRNLLDTTLNTVLTSFTHIIIILIFLLFIEFLMPKYKAKMMYFIYLIILLLVIQPAYLQIEAIQKITRLMAENFISVYPILTVILLSVGATFNLINFQPAMLLLAYGAIYLAEKLLLPIILLTMCLDVSSRFLPEISFKRMAELLRATLLGTVSAIVASYSIFITVGGAMTWAFTGITSEPVKELIQQNIPVIGSFMTESIRSLSQHSSTMSVVVGSWLIGVIWTVSLLPTLKTLLLALLYKWFAAFIEPFSNEETSGLIDDIGKTLLVLCAVSFILAFAFIYTAVFVLVFVKLLMMR